MRRLFTVALLGLAVTAAATDASAQGRRGGRGRAGVMDTARVRQMDSLRTARGDTRRAPDSLRQRRLDSMRTAGVADSARAGRAGRLGGPGGRGGQMGARGALAGIQLNDNEKAAVKTITEKYRAEMEQFREANRGAGQRVRGQNAQLVTQLQLINEREEAEIRAALTAEHQKQFDANVAKRKELGANAAPGRRGPPPPIRRRSDGVGTRRPRGGTAWVGQTVRDHGHGWVFERSPVAARLAVKAAGRCRL
jgi:hypothetical protein